MSNHKNRNSPDAQKRTHLHFLNQQHNLSSSVLQSAFKSMVHNDTVAWRHFAKYFFLSLGIGSVVIGMIFFFAYNWESLHRYAKFALVQSMLFGLLIAAVFTKENKLMSNIFLMGGSVLVGALFALFGQVYQSTADSYSLFVAWSVCISAWVIVARFTALWTLWLVLVNTAIILFIQQVLPFDETHTFLVLLLFNSCVLVSTLLLKHFKDYHIPSWFSYFLVVYCTVLATLGSCFACWELDSHFTDNISLTYSMLIISALSFMSAFIYGKKTKQLIFPVLVLLSTIVIITNLLFVQFELGAFFMAPFFVVISIVVSADYLLALKKSWIPLQVSEQNQTVSIAEKNHLDNNQVSQKRNNIKDTMLYLKKDHLLEISDEETDNIYYAYMSDEQQKSLAMSALYFFGGVLSTLLLMGLFVLTGLVNHHSDMLITGFLLLVSSIYINHSNQSSIFDGVNICFYSISLILFVFGLEDIITDSKYIALFFMLLALTIVPFLKKNVLPFAVYMTAYISFICFIVLVFQEYPSLISHILDLIAVLLMFVLACLALKEHKFLALGNFMSEHYSVLKGATMVVFIGFITMISEGFFLYDSLGYDSQSQNFSLVGIVIIMFLLYLLHLYQKSNNLQKSPFLLLFITFTCALLPTFSYPIIAASLLLTLLAFYINDKMMLGFGICCLLFAMNRYYYNLDMTLLMKSIVMMISGLFFIGSYVVLEKLHTSQGGNHE